MNTKHLLLILSLCLFETAGSQTIYVGGVISTNTTWAADTVKVIADVSVAQGVSLTVGPGTYVEVQGFLQYTFRVTLPHLDQFLIP